MKAMKKDDTMDRIDSVIKSAFKMFLDNACSEEWIIEPRWPDSIECLRCGQENLQAV